MILWLFEILNSGFDKIKTFKGVTKLSHNVCGLTFNFEINTLEANCINCHDERDLLNCKAVKHNICTYVQYMNLKNPLFKLLQCA